MPADLHNSKSLSPLWQKRPTLDMEGRIITHSPCPKCGNSRINELIDTPCKQCLLIAPLDATIEDLLYDVFDEHGCVNADFYCRMCGYNLRGIERNSCCPECGNDINWSLNADQLRFANFNWLRKLRTGTKCLITAAVGLVIAIALIVFLLSSTMLDLTVIIFGSPVVVILIFLIGIWLVTIRDPAAESDPPLSLRKIARWGFIANGLSWLQLLLFETGGSLNHTTLLILFFAILLSGSIASFALHQLAAQVARRIPDQSLAGLAKAMNVFQMIGSGIGLYTISVVAATSGHSRLPGGWFLESCTILLAFPMLAISFIGSFAIVVQLNAALARAINSGTITLRVVRTTTE